jgi:hemin uptake protein HemP
MIMTESPSFEPGSESPLPAPAPPADATRVIRSEEIFAGERVVMIQHAGERYRLLITRNDRLILQK